MNCGPASLNARTACARCLPRGSLPAITTWLLCQMVNKSNCEPLATQYTNDYVARAIANGGGSISAVDRQAIHDFLCTLIQNGLDTKMISMCCMARDASDPNGLIFAVTPVLTRAGNDPWPITAFSPGVSTINADGLRNWVDIEPDPGPIEDVFDTGVVPSVDLSLINAGASVLVKEKDAVNPAYLNGIEMGCRIAIPSGAFDLATKYLIPPDSSFFECWDAPNPLGYIRVATPAPGDGLGFFSGNRTAANAMTLHYGRAGVVNLLGAIATTFGSLPTSSVYLFGINAGGVTNPCEDRISFAAIHDSLTSSEVAILYDAVRLMRQQMGGGDI